MSVLALTGGEREQRQREVDAWVRWRLAQGLDICARETRPSCGSMFEFLERNALDLAEKLATVCDEASRLRREIVRERSLSPELPLEGRWAVFMPAAVDYCAIAQEEGFIDVSDAPGWDVWTDVLDLDCGLVMLIWVPQPLVERIDLAAKMSVLGALAWADSLEMRRSCITGILVSMGLVKWPDEE